GASAAARPVLERVLAMREAALGPDDPEVARTLNTLGTVLKALADFAGARAAYERALEIRERVLGPDHMDVAYSLINLGGLCLRLGEYAQGRPWLERALRIQERLLPADHPDLAPTLNNLGNLLRLTGDYDEARPLLERALEIRTRALGPDNPQVAASLNALATLLREMGDYGQARPYYERALGVRERALGPEHPDVAETLDSLGGLLLVMGDLAGAEQHYLRALAIRQRASGVEHPDTARALSNLGLTHYYARDYGRAKSELERALGIRERTLPPGHPELAETLHGLAAVLKAQGQLREALPYLERALEIARTAYGPQHSRTAELLNGLGTLRSELGDSERVVPLLVEAQAIWERAFGPDHPHVAENLGHLAQHRALSGDREGGLADALRAERLRRDNARLIARSLAEREALIYSSRGARPLDVALGLADLAAREVWDALIRSRALVLDEMASRHRALVAADDPDVARAAAGLDAARSRLARLVVRGPGSGGTETYSAALARAREVQDGAERELAARSAAFRDELARDGAGLDEVSRALPPSAALVAYARYEPASASGSAPEYLAFVLGVAREVAVVRLGPAAKIEAAIARWRLEVGQPPPPVRAAFQRAEERYREAGTSLRRAIWDPLAARLGPAERVFIVPDGALHGVSLATLPATEGYLIETAPTIHYLSAERNLVRGAESPSTGRGLLALGGPTYDTAGPRRGASPRAPSTTYRGPRSSCGEFKQLRFDALPAAAREAREIANLWRATEEQVVVLTGDPASEAAFKRLAPGQRVVHVATHAFFLDGACPSTTSAGSAGARGEPDLPPALAELHGENPLWLSGLALAGANHRESAAPDEEDGIVTAEEVASLDLSGVEWAVLSGCETGLGRVQVGEGMLGLRRAFEDAGARTLILSLWRVDDQATREWMRALYRGRLAGRSTAEAVRSAGLELLRVRRRAARSTHPFAWGAFVASGDWR
ncbi:MAG TPA: CHAT domain-containing tetratricopeptide repeat protein, partial [Candidatus Polarisedimenticolaceae bacterium]|nr:CHAT domain-containing tetratricopeptide repeat protein [Candidatus Polarisedimenticolaceae bacterium]